MSKRQHQQQGILTDLQLPELIEHDENPNLFEHLIEDFQDMMSDKQVLRNCIEKFIDNMVDEFTLGIIFDVHRKCKTNAYCLEVGESGEDDDTNTIALFEQNSLKNNQKCTCTNCERTVAPFRFARHLAWCMGLSDTSRTSRNASRRAVTKKDKGDPSTYTVVPSDDDDDEDWSPRRNKKKDKNGGKKNKGTPKKSLEQEGAEPINVDIEGNFDEVTNLRFMMDQGDRRSYVMDLQERRSNSSSPTEVTGTSTTPPKKRDKSKKKSKGKDRGSPSTSLSFD